MGLVHPWLPASGRGDELEEQLRLARQEGLATTAAEFSAKIRPARPEENAALLYRKLRRPPEGVVKLSVDVLYEQSASSRTEARALLKRAADQLALLDAATKRPRCWFDRDWSEGVAVLMPEYSEMKSGARLLALRGSLSALSGRPREALGEVERIQRMAGHLREEPTAIAAAVADGVESIAIRNLIDWSYLNRREQAYVRALEEAIARRVKPKVREEFSSELYQVLSLIEMTRTPEGRERLGLRGEDIPRRADTIFSTLLDEQESLVKIVKAHRATMAALSLPIGPRRLALEKAERLLYEGLLRFPTAARLHQALSSGSLFLVDRVEGWQARGMQFTAALRALKQPGLPKTIKTSDLLSPFDGKPISYRLEGRQMVIAVSGAGDEGADLTLRVGR